MSINFTKNNILFSNTVLSVTGVQITACRDYKIGVIDVLIPITLQISPALKWSHVTLFSL